MKPEAAHSYRPTPFYTPLARRRFFRSMAIASAGFTLPGYLAEALTLTPLTTEGPLYPLPDDIPLDEDNDLVQLNDKLTLASGIISHISGRILDQNGNPIRNALVEPWHTDHEGNYSRSNGVGRNPACDPNFAGFGQFVTGSDGRYRFRTVKAGLYPGRARHYHWAVTVPRPLSRSATQTGWNEIAKNIDGSIWATQNSNDGVFLAISNAEQKASMLLNDEPVPGTGTGEVHATWDFVSGIPPVEPTHPGGSLVVQGNVVPGPNGTKRFRLTLPSYAGYTYEIYGNPTLGDLNWRCLPFSLTALGSLDNHKITAATNGTLGLFVNAPAVKGHYLVTSRVPGANTGTPSRGSAVPRGAGTPPIPPF